MRIRTALTAIAFAVASMAHASIMGVNSLVIDFTDAGDAGAKAIWSEPEKLGVTTDGLGWDGEAASSRDGWIQTVPLALGLSWRPPYAVTIRVAIHPKPEAFVLNSGQTYTPYAGDLYVRFSPDRRHWSTWQVLRTDTSQDSTEQQNPGRYFSGAVRVPAVERSEYSRRLLEYQRLDVPWKSDEEAAVRWILGRDPEFFAGQLPFIGYVQFRYEAGFYGGQRITSFKADVSYGMGGLHSPPI